MAVTIYHNPRCSKSRKTLELILDSNVAHTVVLYLDQPLDGATILNLARKLEMPVANLLRRGEARFKDATDLPDLGNDAELANWLAEHPIVLQRPIVVHDDSGIAVIGRPPENVQGLLTQ
jgi:arsenate reductase